MRCAAHAACGQFVTTSDLAVLTDHDVAFLRRCGWQVVNGAWICPDHLPADRRNRPAAMARRANPHCATCGDTRGGPYGHEGFECTWKAAA